MGGSARVRIVCSDEPRRTVRGRTATRPGFGRRPWAYPRDMASDQLSPTEHRQHVEHDGHGGDGDHAAGFRDRFWLSLVLTIPVVAYSEMVQEWLGFTPPQFPGSQGVAPGLGTGGVPWGGG